MSKAYSTYSVDLSDQNIETTIEPETPFLPPMVTLKGSFGSIQIYAANEQLAEIEYAFRTHLNGIRYPETPDQQTILNNEINQSIEEEIA
ncbi:hypothetical protein [Paenibacillus lutimineralis]|uniref:Uncharacterized protein n=1 Tax=Paenibacillus lutimineralis TaxID=2707005 RepID=A0A3Q9ICV8_9BACL|nr:hypothetical protein [Paenibacillus lutimineralis]AZS15325.1 hypothetical protein EI981_13220 [Paenibacillus lutimineralis]